MSMSDMMVNSVRSWNGMEWNAMLCHVTDEKWNGIVQEGAERKGEERRACARRLVCDAAIYVMTCHMISVSASVTIVPATRCDYDYCDMLDGAISLWDRVAAKCVWTTQHHTDECRSGNT